ncbi:hypothetical protein V6U78_06245 [Marinospirillum sp. MEB164]|uniref:Aldehyde-activating protein n=1 Tax=Marinospirillum alkalitolerans TaxID=3123374 RepID=A0ABW8PWH2_9GAMM
MTKSLSAPCCQQKIGIALLLSKAEWASHLSQVDFWQWNYYRCPHCQTPCWFGYNQESAWCGIYGAAPVADLIPVSPIDGMPQPVIGAQSVIFEYAGVLYEIQRGKHYWHSMKQTGGITQKS